MPEHAQHEPVYVVVWMPTHQMPVLPDVCTVCHIAMCLRQALNVKVRVRLAFPNLIRTQA